jgi:hypothetical protein
MGNSLGHRALLWITHVSFVFTTYVNDTGYDSAADMSEETKRAEVAGPWGMVTALVGSSFLGLLLVARWLHGLLTVTSNSRMIDAFSRGAVCGTQSILAYRAQLMVSGFHV